MEQENKAAKQKAFDTAVRGLAGQGWQKSFGGAGQATRCKYRGPNGLKCAVGHLLEDSELPKGADKADFAGLPEHPVNIAAKKFEVEPAFINRMRIQHDTAGPSREKMPQAFRTMQLDHGLSWPTDVEVPQ